MPTMLLPCKLNEEDRALYADQLAHLNNTMEMLRAERRSINSKLKLRIDKMQAEANKISGAVEAGEEKRTVNVIYEDTDQPGIVKRIRTDLNEAVDTYALTPEESQGSMFSPRPPWLGDPVESPEA